MKNKLLLFLPLTIFLFSCASKKDGASNSSNSFNVIEASYSYWTSGIKNGGDGTEFYIKLVSNVENASIDSLYIGEKVFKTISKPFNSTKFFDIGKIQYAKGDTIVIRASAQNKLPLDSKNTLKCIVNNSTIMVELKNMKESKTKAYQ